MSLCQEHQAASAVHVQQSKVVVAGRVAPLVGNDATLGLALQRPAQALIQPASGIDRAMGCQQGRRGRVARARLDQALKIGTEIVRGGGQSHIAGPSLELAMGDRWHQAAQQRVEFVAGGGLQGRGQRRACLGLRLGIGRG